MRRWWPPSPVSSLPAPALRLGLFGGTFDPVHRGHLEAARQVKEALDLDRMLLMVANDPWQKDGGVVASAEDRLAMVTAACVDYPGLEPGRMEIDRGGVTYTVDTVDELLEANPGARIYLVVGADVVSQLPTWGGAERLSHLVTVAVINRPGAEIGPVPPGWNVEVVEVEPLDISSTGVRERLRTGGEVDGLLPPPVVRLLEERPLYAANR